MDKVFVMTHVTRNQPTASQEAARNLNEVETEVGNEDNLAMQCLSQKHALRRFSAPDPVPSTSTAHSSSTNYWTQPPPPPPPATSSFQFEGRQEMGLVHPGLDFDPEAGPKRANVPVVVPFQQLEDSVGHIENFFSEDLFSLFEVPFDKMGKNVPDSLPNKASLDFSYNKYHHKPNMRMTNSCKLDFYVSLDKNSCNISIYKRLNYFTGHNITLSLREVAEVLRASVETARDAMVRLAYEHKQRDMRNASTLYGQDKFYAFQRAEAAFAEKMQRIGRQF